MAAKSRKKASAKKPAKAKAKAKAKPMKKAAAKLTSKKSRPAAKSAKARPARPAKAAAPATPQYHTVTPVLTIAGADDAIAFFKQAFGAKERTRMPGPDGKIMHAELVIGDSVVMVNDVMNQPATRSSLHIYVDDCDALYSRALAAGASPTMPLTDMFWGDRWGTVTDPYGNTWGIATHKEDVSPEEMERRMAEMPPPGGPPPLPPPLPPPAAA